MARELVFIKSRWVVIAALSVFIAGGARAQTYTALDLGAPQSGLYGQASALNNKGQVVGGYSVPFRSGYAFLYASGSTIDIGALGLNDYSYASDINNSGQVVGWGDTPSGSFLYTNGTLIDLGTLPGGNRSRAYAINNKGQVVGESEVGAGLAAFLYSNGTMTELSTLPGYCCTVAYAINDNGEVVGSSSGSAGPRPFLYSNGTMTDLGVLPGGLYGWAYSINNFGQVVGFSEIPTPGGGTGHAFLYSGGSMFDLGTIPGGLSSVAYGINNFGQIVGSSYTGINRAFLYSGGVMTDLNSLVTLPSGVYLTSAVGINDLGQIAANASDGHAYLLTPIAPGLPAGSPASLLTVLNPFAPDAVNQQAPSTLNVPDILTFSSPATSVAADGESAVVLSYQSASPAPVTFEVAASGEGLPAGTAVGSLGQFDPNYLIDPNPARNGLQSYEVMAPTYGPDAAGNYWFLALLWGPNAMPVPFSALVDLTVTAQQMGQARLSEAPIALEPPPVILVHGIWSSADGSGFSAGSHGFYDFISSLYPHNQIYAADYGPESSDSFSDPSIQNILLSTMTDALAGAANAGMAARTVDVVAHSMGGLVTRYLLSEPSSLSPVLLANPVHKLITIGTPHQGTQLATTLEANLTASASPGSLPCVPPPLEMEKSVLPLR